MPREKQTQEQIAAFIRWYAFYAGGRDTLSDAQRSLAKRLRAQGYDVPERKPGQQPFGRRGLRPRAYPAQTILQKCYKGHDIEVQWLQGQQDIKVFCPACLCNYGLDRIGQKIQSH